VRFVSNVPSAEKSSCMHPMELLGEWVMWNLVSVRLETVLLSVQYRCMVCAEHTNGSKIILVHPMIHHGDEGQVEACLSPFGDSANRDTR
jgi:hypothetical protein